MVADTAGKWPYLEDVTADFMYLRLHGDKQLYASGYTRGRAGTLVRTHPRLATRPRARDASAREWRGDVSQTRDVFCYFDNDVKVRAPFDADRLMQKLGLTRSDTTFIFPNRRVLRNIRPWHRCRHSAGVGQRPATAQEASARLTTPATISAAPATRHGPDASRSSREPNHAPTSVDNSRAGATWLTGARRMANSTRM